MKNKKGTKENWEKEFEKEFDMYNPIHDDGTKIPVWSGSDFKNIKSFISKLLKSEKEKNRQKFIKILEELNEFVETESGKSGRKEILQKIQEVINQLKDDEKIS